MTIVVIIVIILGTRILVTEIFFSDDRCATVEISSKTVIPTTFIVISDNHGRLYPQLAQRGRCLRTDMFTKFCKCDYRPICAR